MEKRARGEIRVHERNDGTLTFSIRFRGNRKRHSITLGTNKDGWTWRKAERKLDDALAQVRAGVWQPEPTARPEKIGDLTFHEFASRWWTAKSAELSANTQLDYEWRLKKHLLPFFADMAGQMDRQKRQDLQIGRRPMIVVMAQAGLRVTELCQLRWRAVDIHHERLIIEQAKTDAGRRQVDLTLDVIDELNGWRAQSGSVQLDDFVFATANGRHRDRNNIRTILSRVVEKVNQQRSGRGYAPLPPVVPHTLRRTYISLMLEAGAPLHYVMDQAGHEDSKTTLEIYAHVQKRVSRPQVKRAFEELLARTDVGEIGVPAEAREMMSDRTAERAN